MAGQQKDSDNKGDRSTGKKIVLLMVCFAVALPLFAQNKMSKRLSESTTVLKTVLDKQDMPKSIPDNSAP
jgi:hypothetical protein